MRRSFWMAVGAVLGVWVVGKAQRAASRCTPSGAAAAAQRHVRHLANDVQAAWAEGKRTKQATEVELRQMARSRPAIDVASRAGLPAAEAAEELPVRR